MKTDKKIEKMAAKDAEEWLAAEMFYGDGAGVRRRHVDAVITDKYAIPGYFEAFEKAYASLNKTEFAERAIKERKKIDRAAKAGKNLRALKNGNLRGLSTGVYVVVGAGYVYYVAHQNGWDKEIEALAKQKWEQLKDSRARRKAEAVIKAVKDPED